MRPREGTPGRAQEEARAGLGSQHSFLGRRAEIGKPTPAYQSVCLQLSYATLSLHNSGCAQPANIFLPLSE